MAHFLCHLGAHILEPFCSISILPKTIPCDYEGEMGVPISIFDKLDTDQFELVGIMSNPETLPGIRVIGPEWVDLYRSQGGTGHITANMKSLVGIDANGNAVSYYERVIIRNKNPKPRRNI